MARKNNSQAEASNSIHFDSRTKTVMAEASHENIKEKVQAVREVVPGKSNNEVILVLQFYDYSVEKTIQAYLEDGAKAALQEWNFTGSKQPNKKRKSKKKANNEKAAEKVIPTSASSEVENKENTAVNGENDPIPNGHLPSGLELSETESPLESPATPYPSSSLPIDKKAPPSSSDASSAALPQRSHHHHGRGHGKGDSHSSHHTVHAVKQRERTTSEMSSSSVGDGHSRKSLEKAFKDLQRQTTSLERLRLLLDHEVDRSYKSVKNVFEELRTGLNKREEQLLAEMDSLKKEAYEMLETRQNKASELKVQVDRAERLKEAEITELRSEIKHFVGERRHDEELGRTTRFLYDSDHMMEEIEKFGEVVHIAKSKNTNRRPSVSSVASSAISHDDNHDDDLSHSKEVLELQDRLKSSLGLQDSSSRPSTAATHNGTKSSEDKVEDISGYRTFVARPPNKGSRSPSSGKNASRTKSPQLSSSTSPPGSPAAVGGANSHGGSPRSGDNYRGRGGRGGGSRGRGRGYGNQRGRGRGYGNANQGQRSPSDSQRQGGPTSSGSSNAQGTSGGRS